MKTVRVQCCLSLYAVCPCDPTNFSNQASYCLKMHKGIIYDLERQAKKWLNKSQDSEFWGAGRAAWEEAPRKLWTGLATLSTTLRDATHINSGSSSTRQFISLPEWWIQRHSYFSLKKNSILILKKQCIHFIWTSEYITNCARIQQTFSIKGQMVIILGFSANKVCVTAAWVCCCSVKAVREYINE